MLQFKRLSILVSLYAVCVLLAACDGADSGSQSREAGYVATSPSEADLVFVAAVDVNTLDPQKMSWNHDIRTAGCLYEALVRYKLPEATLEPGVAESWTVSEDGLAYEFTLREDAKWSNGDAVTPADFMIAWQRALMPDFAADYAQLFYCIKGSTDFFQWRSDTIKNGEAVEFEQIEKKFAELVAVSSPEQNKLRVVLKEPTPYFLELCAFVTFMPNHSATMRGMLKMQPDTKMYELPSNYWTSPDQLVCNGPYVLKEYAFKEYIFKTQNPHWWNRSSMGNTSILQKVIESPETALLNYSTGDVDWLPDIPTASSIAADLINSSRKDVHTTPWAGTYFYSFNCNDKLADGSKNPLADRRVRRALSMAIDRKTIVSQVTRVNQPTAHTFVVPGSLPGYTPPAEQGVKFDVAGAKKLLVEAGYSNPAELSKLSILFNTGGGHEPVAQAIQQMWKKHLGITVKIESMEVRSFREKLKTQKYTIARAAWIGDYRDATTFLDKYRRESGNNDAKFDNARYDSLLKQAAAEVDVEKRIGLLEKAEGILMAEQPIAPIYHYITLNIYDPKKVSGIHPNSWNFRRLEQIRVSR